MPQLMPLNWIMYMFIFLFLIFMSSFVFSIYSNKDFTHKSNSLKNLNSLWLW